MSTSNQNVARGFGVRSAPRSRRGTDEPSPDSTAPWRPWSEVEKTVDKMWDPLNSPHHSIIGLTGSGKSYLAINGILRPMCPWDRVLIVDSKGDDPLVSTTGRPCKVLPSKTVGTGMGRKREAYDSWHRLVVSDKREEARNQVGSALARVYSEGHWVILFDEIRDITDPKSPGLGLSPIVDNIYRKGRSRSVSIVACTQAPRWVVGSFYDQASFAWIGRIRDKLRQKRLLEIGGLDTTELELISTLERRQWLLAADNGEYFARTMVENKGNE